MKAEYFPPNEDVILQNEAPMDFYILVTGAMVLISPEAKFLCFNTSQLVLNLFKQPSFVIFAGYADRQKWNRTCKLPGTFLCLKAIIFTWTG